MTNKEQLKQRLLNAYKSLYKSDPSQFVGAMKIGSPLKLSKKEQGHNFYGVHKILKELERDGSLEQKTDSGFRYKK